ncbi:MAG: hypothetical protein PHI32_08500 [Dysgonamonadaceae bacterium]|nr:hypothetical protein [Dysgonamonadaceae bacterium]MDD4729256.1 hypothetical protein [Dysgonamonadaceae bacterium]
MNTPLLDTVSSYIKSYSRNKIIFHKEGLSGINSIDVGKLLAQSLFNFENENRLPMRTTVELDKILSNAIFEHPNFGKVLAIANVGILFESELKQNFYRIMDNYSTNNLLFIEWEGEIEDNAIYFLSKEKGIKININNLSHIAI